MRAGNSASHRKTRGPSDAANGIEQRRIIGRASSCRGLAALLPASHSALELYVALRRLHVLEQSVDDLLDGDSLRFRREVGKNAMTQHGARNTNDVRGSDGESSREKGMRLRAEYECLSSARPCSPSHVLLHDFRCIRFSGTRCTSEARSETQSGISGGNVTNETLKCARLLAIDHRTKRLEVSTSCGAKNSNFRILVGISNANVEEESIELRFGKRIRSLLLDWILRSENEERLGQQHRLTSSSHAMLLHRLEKRSLSSRRSAVDLVCENDISED